MEKRLIVFVALSLLILLSWSALVSKSHHIDNKVLIQKTASVNPPELPPVPAIAETQTTPSEKLLEMQNEKLRLIFNASLAAIKEVVFFEHQAYKFDLGKGFWLKGDNQNFIAESISGAEAKFVYKDDYKQIVKRLNIVNSSYSLELEIEVQNLSKAPLDFPLSLVLGVLNSGKDPLQARNQDITVGQSEKTLHLNGRKEGSFSHVKFLGLRERYFCVIIEPKERDSTVFVNRINTKETEVGLSLPVIKLAPGEKTLQKFRIYLGPQKLQLINQMQPEWSAVIYYGTFDFIAQILAQLLGFLYNLVRNWGLAIIILSIVVYLLLFPLTIKQLRSAKQMQNLQPRIEELRRVHKDNPQKLNKEIMELYRLNKINPFSGCLPLVLQIPVFFALYQVLMRSVALKGAPFLWIKDLSEPDRLFVIKSFPGTFPVIGNEVNILPILMTLGMFFQQKMTMPTGGGSSAEQQKLMLILFPIFFGFIFYRMPSGLVLYWFTNSLFMLFYQLRLHKHK